MSVEDRATRLRLAVKAAGGNQLVAARSGIPLPTLNRYLAGQDMKAAAMVALAIACEVTIEWLVMGNEGLSGPHLHSFPSEEVVEQASSSQSIRVYSLKYYDVRDFALEAASKAPLENAPEVLISEQFLTEVLCLSADNLALLRVADDSMSSVLYDGDILVLDCRPSHNLIGMHAVVIRGSLTVRRLMLATDGTVRIFCDNRRYGEEIVALNRVSWGAATGTADLLVIGRVVHHVHPPR